jgi:hypothetical protein
MFITSKRVHQTMISQATMKIRGRRATSRHSSLFVSLFTACALLATGPARADDASERREILDKIDDNLAEVQSELDQLYNASDARKLDKAESLVDAVKSLVSRLERVEGDDPKAKEVVDRYPRHIERFKSASEMLRRMKGKKDSNTKSREECERADEALVTAAKGFAQKLDPAGIDELPRAASDAKRAAEAVLTNVDRHRRDMEDWKGKVDNFDASDGKWSDVRAKLRVEADRILGVWKDELREVDAACKSIKAGVDHPEVREALSRLRDSAAGRRGMLERLDKLVGELADKIEAVPPASSGSALDYPRERLNAIDGLLKQLQAASGGDVNVKQVASTWPELVRDARAALEPLQALKAGQHELADAPARCLAREKKLDDFIDRNGKILSGADKIRDYAAELRAPVVFEWTEAGKRMAALQAAHGLVLRFSEHTGRWSEVTSALRGGADRLLGDYKDALEATKRACAKFLDPQEHPAATAAINTLEGHANSLNAKLEADIDAWIRKAREFGRLDVEGMKRMSAAYCGGDWGGNDAYETNMDASQVASTISGEMEKAIAGVMTDYPDLLVQVNALAVQPTLQKRVETLRHVLTTEHTRLAAVIPNRKWRGNYDPHLFYFARQYGIDMHRQMHARYHCSVPLTPDSDAKFPEGKDHSKPDCISLEGCIIYEFKPDSRGGKAKGATQIREYADLVPKYYNDHYQQKKAPPPSLGGPEFLKKLVARCLVSGQIQLRAEVVYYDSRKCEMSYE